jgi:hypothetical protein
MRSQNGHALIEFDYHSNFVHDNILINVVPCSQSYVIHRSSRIDDVMMKL